MSNWHAGNTSYDAWWLKGYETAAGYFVSDWKEAVLRAQFNYLLASGDPIDGPFLAGLADGLASAFGA